MIQLTYLHLGYYTNLSVEKGDILGVLKVAYKNEPIEEYDLFAFEKVKKLNVFSRLMKSINFLIWGDV